MSPAQQDTVRKSCHTIHTCTYIAGRRMGRLSEDQRSWTVVYHFC